MHETLIQRIERARRLLTKGSIPPGELDTLLADVQAALSQVQDPVATALRTLSYSELEAMEAVIAALPAENGGLVVSSKVADEVGVTRSVIVNTLRKLESAGVVETRSLGMKGTHVKLLNGLTVRTLLERIERFNSRVA